MISNIISTASFLVLLSLSFYILLTKKKSIPNITLSLAVIILAIIEAADMLSLNIPDSSMKYKSMALFFESLLPAATVLFGFTYARQGSLKSIKLPAKVILAATVALPGSLLFYSLGDFFYAPDLKSEKILYLGQAGYWFYMLLMAFCVIALISIEAAFVTSSGPDRWKIKYEVFGITAMLGVLIFYFGQGLLYRIINMNLEPVRSGVFVVSSSMIAYSRHFRGNDVRLTVSRHVLYRSLSLIVVGLYFIILGLMGQGMRYLGVPFSRDLTIFIAFASGMAMLLILFSERLRRRVKIFISKHFYAHKHDYREEWLKFTERLSSCKSIGQVYDVILSTFMGAFGMESGALYLQGSDGKSYRRVVGREMPDSMVQIRPNSCLICGSKESGMILSVGDKDCVQEADEAVFLRETGARLVIPLPEDGKVIGIVACGKQVAPEVFIHEDFELMKTFARQAALAIRNFTLSEELAVAREIAAMARVSSFVAHDLKNLASSLSLLLNNAEDYMAEPDFQRDMLNTIRSTVDKMMALVQKLRVTPEKQSLRLKSIDIDALARGTLDEMTKNKSGIEYSYAGLSLVVMADMEEVRKVIFNILLNAVEAVNGSGVIRVETGRRGEMAFIRVEDNGPGISEEYQRDQMFRPFRTTKDKGLGIGLYQSKQIMEAHGGRIEVSSIVGEGSVFMLYLPIASTESGNENSFHQG